MIDFFVLIILLFFIGIILQRYNLLLDNINFSKHKIYIYSKNKIPITGGLFFLISYISLNFNELDNVFKFLLILIFLAGFFSDNVKNFSPKRITKTPAAAQNPPQKGPGGHFGRPKSTKIRPKW